MCSNKPWDTQQFEVFFLHAALTLGASLLMNAKFPFSTLSRISTDCRRSTLQVHKSNRVADFRKRPIFDVDQWASEGATIASISQHEHSQPATSLNVWNRTRVSWFAWSLAMPRILFAVPCYKTQTEVQYTVNLSRWCRSNLYIMTAHHNNVIFFCSCPHARETVMTYSVRF